MIGAYLETARLLGQRTAELHLALGLATRTIPRSRRSRSPRSTSARSTSRCATWPASVFQLLRERLRALARSDARPTPRRLLELRGRRCCSAFRAIVGAQDQRPCASAATATTTSARCCTRQGLRHHRLRGRAGAVAERAADQALAAARRGRHAALVPLRRAHGAVRTPHGGGVHPAGGRAACSSRGRASGTAGSSSSFLRAYLRRRGDAQLRAARRATSSPCCSTSCCSRRRLRARLRAQQPARLGADPAARHPRAARTQRR